MTDGMDDKTLRDDIVAIGRLLADKGMVAANDGNISARTAAGTILVTPTGVAKGCLTAEDLLTVDRQGRVIAGAGRATSELGLHLAVYDTRPDARAVVHAHPPAATAFSICGGVGAINLAEAVLVVGGIGHSPYATPGSAGVAAAVTPLLAECDAVLLENHGALTLGSGLWDAYYRMESLEHYCHINMYVRLLGGGRTLSPSEVDALRRIRAGSGA
ncbi:MAG: class II aldolase/adducin family protein [Planctomycetes bacterium]|nr:class II aldolase/adducin family protein [Planctomycetota bacterium]